MNRTISLIIGIAAAVVVAAVPPAFGEGRLANSQPQVTPSKVYLDGGERVAVSRPAVAAHSSYVDANERGTGPLSPVSVMPATSRGDSEWPPFGVGFGIGIALALGLVLAHRSARPRMQPR